jgi:hypothetical protein
MSVGPLGGIAGSAAGTSLAQSKGSDVERSQQDAASQTRRTQSNQKAESASGIGETDGEDHQTADRDADGRRLWEAPPEAGADETSDQNDHPEQAPAKDTSGQRGNLLDLSG